VSDQRVTDDQARTFAAYDGEEGTEWYDADPSLLNSTEGEGEAGILQRDEFLWLRDLALDLLDARARVLALELELKDVSPL
jgi:hypothetical protein